MRGRQLLYPNIRRDSNRRAQAPVAAAESGQSANLIAYPPATPDHGYVHRLGQSQGCELRGLGERGRTRQLNGGTREWAHWGRPFRC